MYTILNTRDMILIAKSYNSIKSTLRVRPELICFNILLAIPITSMYYLCAGLNNQHPEYPLCHWRTPWHSIALSNSLTILSRQQTRRRGFICVQKSSAVMCCQQTSKRHVTHDSTVNISHS